MSQANIMPLCAMLQNHPNPAFYRKIVSLRKIGLLLR
jgi:hypothetical protein